MKHTFCAPLSAFNRWLSRGPAGSGVFCIRGCAEDMATTAEQDPLRPILSKHLNVSSARFPPLESACAENAGRQVYPLNKPEAPGRGGGRGLHPPGGKPGWPAQKKRPPNTEAIAGTDVPGKHCEASVLSEPRSSSSFLTTFKNVHTAQPSGCTLTGCRLGAAHRPVCQVLF